MGCREVAVARRPLACAPRAGVAAPRPGDIVRRPSRSERPFVPDPRKTTKSKYTADRNFAGAFEGETVTRRRFMTLTAHGAGAIATSAFLLPALGFAAGSAIFERPEAKWKSVGAPDDFPNDTYIPKVITEVSGIGEVGKT